MTNQQEDFHHSSDDDVADVPQEASEEAIMPTKKRFRWGWMLFFLIVIILLIGAAWLQITTGFFTSFSKNNTLQAQVAPLQQIVQQQSEQISSNRSEIEQIDKTGNKPSVAWLLTESEYLIQFANMTSSLERNIPATIQLLEMAQSHLKKVNDNMAEEIVSLLSQDISQLKAVPNVDVTKIYLSLQSLSAQMGKLPLLSEKTTPKKKTVTKNIKNQSLWRRGLETSLNTIKDLVIVRHRNQDVRPLMTMEQRQLVILNSQNLFEQAQFGLLHREQLVYQVSLEQIQNLIERYFLQTNSETIALLKQLKDLSQLNIAPTLPDLNKPLTIIQAFNNSRTRSQNNKQSTSVATTQTSKKIAGRTS